jgi:hypothetical protein
MALPELSEKLKKRIDLKDPMLFRLAHVGKRDRMVYEGNDETIHGASYPPTTTIFDKFEKEASQRLKIISNVVGTRPVKRNGRTEYEEDVEYIRFSSAGNLMVLPHEVHKLAYLRLSDHNGSNPFRDQSKPVLWIEANSPDMELRSKVREADLQLEAEQMIVHMPWADLKPFAADFITVANVKAEEVRWNLRQKAKEAGMARAILAAAPSEEVRVKLLVADAKSLRILIYAQANGWRFEEEEGKYFFKPDVGVHPDLALVKWLASDEGALRLVQLKESLKEVESEDI